MLKLEAGHSYPKGAATFAMNFSTCFHRKILGIASLTTPSSVVSAIASTTDRSLHCTYGLYDALLAIRLTVAAP